MFKLISNLINLNAALATKARSVMAYDEALVFYLAKDYKQAMPLMVEASELGNAQAMALLGTMNLLGEGVKENGPEALKWLQASVDAGYESALSLLGMAYATGKAGVKIDIPKAQTILTLCAEKGDQKSAKMLSMIKNGEGMFKNINKQASKRR
jgi:TPR repeat protein